MWHKNIVVQAGGMGSRLGHLTSNRPKCLVPVENRPMLFHLFEQFPKSNFLIIGDAHFEVLETYMALFAPINYRLIRSTGAKGTLAGMSEALALVPQGTPCMVIWSDLILPPEPVFPEQPGNYIVSSPGLPCRWKFEAGALVEEASCENGIAGLFLLEDASLFADAPRNGAFTDYLARYAARFKPWRMSAIREFGQLSVYESLSSPVCRSFNSMEIKENRVVKRPMTEKGRQLAAAETEWYRAMSGKGAPVPTIYNYTPLVMERIKGATIADLEEKDIISREKALSEILKSLEELHAIGSASCHQEDVMETYAGKTRRRLEKIRPLVPASSAPCLTINGKQCRNPYLLFPTIAELAHKFMPTSFTPIHGDCTFSNMLLNESGKVVFIDPRGYFGKSLLYGDPAYDYAKVYYSLAGNYDNFNKKHFRLHLHGSEATVFIQSNGWERLEAQFFTMLPAEVKAEKIRFLHALIWLSLTTYVWEDYDAVLAAFYTGTYLLDEVLNGTSI